MRTILLALIALLPNLLLAQNRPNVIFIISDDHTSQAISAYGSKLAQTPNIDRIAKEGAILYNNIVSNSICGPSRATLLTGKYSHVNGYKFNERQFDISQPVFPEELQKSGYQTAWIGKMHLGSLPHGFDYLNILPGHGSYYNSDFVNSKNETHRYEGYVTDVITRLSKEWLESRDKNKPFFIVVGHKATHRSWLPSLQDLGAYDNVTFPIPDTFYDTYQDRIAAHDQDMSIEKTMLLAEDLKVNPDYNSKSGWSSYNRFTPEQKAQFKAYYDKVEADFTQKKLTGKALTEWKFQRYMRDYLATAKSLDRNIGELLEYLDQTGLSKNTVVVYTSDQGFYLGEHGWFDKRFIYEESLKTPFVIRYPGVIKAGTKVNQVVSNVDWAPTLLNIMNTKIPSTFQGHSFLPLLTGKTSGWKSESYYHYYEYPEPHHVYPHFGIRTDRYTLAKFYGTKNFWELYDIKNDPKNLHNLYNDKRYAKVINDLKKKLVEQIKLVKDDEALPLVD
ncbi:sulfatase family protein [Flectobacillus major]|uniref:sulfatase family protein n=1 Tax=Flectobacillus major TaxID=103 RepID=UPI000408939F|nr:sulfatase [Flectobacillus major]